MPAWNSATIRSRSAAADATVQERGVDVEVVADVLLQQLAHLAELCEHQRPFVDVEQLGDELVEAVELAGATGQPRAVAQRLGGVVAHLFQAGQCRQHATPPAHAFFVRRVVEQLVDDLLVQHRLLAGELGEGDLLDLVGQVGQQPPVGLGAPQHERLGEPAQPLGGDLDRRSARSGCRSARGTAAGRRAAPG